MTIKDLIPRAREVGQIRLGKTVEKNGRKIPQRLDWFELLKPTQSQNSDDPWVRDEELHKNPSIGPRPTALRIMCDSDALEDVLHTSYDLYRAKNRPRYCSGDGERATLTLFKGDCLLPAEKGMLSCQRVGQDGRYQEETQRRPLFQLAQLDMIEGLERKQGKASDFWMAMQEVKVPNFECVCPLISSDDDRKKCKPHGILRVMLRDYPRFGGAHVFRTTSWNTITAIMATLDKVQRMFGVVAGIPMRLCCQKQKVNVGGRKQLATVAHLEVEGSLDEVLTNARRLAATRKETRDAVLAIGGPVDFDKDSEENLPQLLDEFHPDIDDAVVEDDEPEPEPEPDPEPTPPEEPEFAEGEVSSGEPPEEPRAADDEQGEEVVF